jgi:N-acetylglucosamine malate deacetylase 1
MNILAIGPHPDDVEFGCAAVLIKEVRKGNRVKVLVLSRGEAGSSGTPESREQEARNAARVIGGSIEFLELGGDCRIEYTPENGFKIAAQIREFQPAIVLAPNPEENQHPDHIAVGRLTRDACRFARYGGLDALRTLPVHKIDHLYLYNITQHGGRTPDIVIDIGDVADVWEEAMRCHETQMKTKGYIDLKKAAARMLGMAIGCEYAVGLYVNDPVRLENLSDLTLSSRNF